MGLSFLNYNLTFLRNYSMLVLSQKKRDHGSIWESHYREIDCSNRSKYTDLDLDTNTILCP